MLSVSSIQVLKIETHSEQLDLPALVEAVGYLLTSCVIINTSVCLLIRHLHIFLFWNLACHCEICDRWMLKYVREWIITYILDVQLQQPVLESTLKTNSESGNNLFRFSR